MAGKKVTITLYTGGGNSITYRDAVVGSSLTPELEFTYRQRGSDLDDRIVTTLPYIIEE